MAEEKKPLRQKIDVSEALGQEVPEELHPLLQKFVDNLKIIGLAVGLVLAGVGGYALFGHFKDVKLKETRDALAATVAQKSGSARVQALEELAADAPDTLRASVLLELARALHENKEFAKAVPVWKDLAEVTDDNFQLIAKLGQASALSGEGRHSEALDMLKNLKADAPKSYIPHITRQIASEAEAAGDLAGALSAYQELKSLDTEGSQVFLDYKIKQFQTRLGG
ncbi:MAG: tetratricopeptide repeat protein [Thermodesulfobacteriota bacterium]|nr:tetratricopeptide repeat protein [Thermodesulfobacteriota bacterium]